MKEFIDIYRFFTTNHQKTDWYASEIKQIEEHLDQISPLIQNGDLLINALKRELREHFEDKNIQVSLHHIIDDVLKIEQIVNNGKQSNPIKNIDTKPLVSVKKHEKQKPKEPIWQGIFPKDQILAKYNTVFIYKPIVDEIMDDENLPDKFKHKDLAKFFYDHYKHVLHKKISESSAKIYKTKYLTYLIEQNMITKELTDAGIVFIKNRESKDKDIETKDTNMVHPGKQEPIENIGNMDLENAILLEADQSNWFLSLGVPTLTIVRRFGHYTRDEVELALAKLISDGKAYQSSPKKVRFIQQT